jgi:hypothetical protein
LTNDIKPFPVTDTNVTHLVIELFGGDNNLSSFIRDDLREMAAGNHGSIAMIGMADYANAGGQVIELSPTKGLRVVEKLGEIDTGDPDTLANFIARAMVTYPDVRHRALGFWDHGTGVFDENDIRPVILETGLRGISRQSRGPTPPARRLFIPRQKVAADAGTRAMLHDDTSGGILTNAEASGVLRAAFHRAGSTRKFDLLFSDTCLNGMVEVLDQFEPFASVIVGSEELEPGAGWDYERFFRAMSEKPPLTPAAWGRQAVDAFGNAYRNHPNLFPCTLAAFRAKNAISEAFGGLVAELEPLGRSGFSKLIDVRLDTQSFARHDSYDIRDFASRLVGQAGAKIDAAARRVVAAVDKARVRNVALGDNVPNATGLAFWFPADRRSFSDTAGTYRELEFDKTVHWADYLKRFLG